MARLGLGRSIIVAVLLASCSAEQEPPVPDIHIVGYGILENDSIAMQADETSSVGAKIGRSQGLRVGTQTDQIPIRPGLGYGIAFVVKNAAEEEVKIRVVLRSSNPCILKASGKVVYYNDSVLTVRVGQLRHIGGRIPASEDENHCAGETQPGTDTFELYLGYRKLAEKTFHLYREY